MIKSFGNKATFDLFHGIVSSKSRKIPTQIVEQALMKLDLINAAVSIQDLKSPPGNRLELLSGNLYEYHSIRINKQWRIIFKWIDSNALEVSIVDYHD